MFPVIVHYNEQILRILLPQDISSRDAPAFMRRHVEKEIALPPVEQSWQNIDKPGSLPPSFRVTKRAPRTPLVSVEVYSPAMTQKSAAYCIQADLDDTVLDLKFMLVAHTNWDAECHRFYFNENELDDSTLVKDLTSSANLRLRFQIVYRDKSGDLVHRSVPKLLSALNNEFPLNTVAEMFRDAVKRYANIPYLGKRSASGEYVFLSYAEVEQKVIKIANGLYHLGFRKGDSIGILSINRPEWIMADLACAVSGLVSVPLYDTLGLEALHYIIEDSQMKAIFFEVSKTDLVQDLMKQCPTVRNAFTMDASIPGRPSLESIQFYPPSIQFSIVNPSDLHTLCYTSGTTGQPKGVRITHANMVSACYAVFYKTPQILRNPGEVGISYLTLAHIYGRVLETSSLLLGHGMGYFGGKVENLLDDIAALKPSLFPGVPRVWQKVNDRILSQVEQSNIISKTLFNQAVATKKALLQQGNGSTIWDIIVFRKVRAKFGGNLKSASSGAAPLSPSIAEFLHACLGCDFMEGYGLSETSAVSCVSHGEDKTFGHVGTPSTSCEIKLVSVPEMDYLTSDQPCPRGEIWIRGPAVFEGYHQNAEKTEESMTLDRWFKTGDIGTWLSNGNLKIIDRKKNIFKLAQGEYIRPEFIENVFKQNKYIANLFVYGSSFQNFLVAIVVPEAEYIVPWAQSRNLPTGLEKLIQTKECQDFLLLQLQRTGTQEQLKGFEMIKRIKVISEDFSVENGLLTPSLKLKRHSARVKFQAEIDAMYALALPNSKL